MRHPLRDRKPLLRCELGPTGLPTQSRNSLHHREIQVSRQNSPPVYKEGMAMFEQVPSGNSMKSAGEVDLTKGLSLLRR
jgi:hypothetical protein